MLPLLVMRDEECPLIMKLKGGGGDGSDFFGKLIFQLRVGVDR